MENIVLREFVPIGVLVRVLMVLFSIIIFLITIILLGFGNLTNEDSYGLILGWGVLAFVLFLFWNFRGLEITVTNHKLQVKYGLFNKKSIRLEEISSCKIIKASFGRYGGVGIRYGLDGSIAYSTSFGNAIEIVPINGKTFVFSSNKPEKICKIIIAQKS
jgi:hypothetical protein